MRYLINTGIFTIVLSVMSCAAKPGLSKNPRNISDTDRDSNNITDVVSLSCEDSVNKIGTQLKPEGIIGIYWKLVELNGKSILNDSSTKEPHFVLKSSDNRITGNGGCNGFGGTYELTKGNGIRITNLISTKMACVDITYESEFLNVLAKADNYLIGDSLRLNKNDEILAKFVSK